MSNTAASTPVEFEDAHEHPMSHLGTPASHAIHRERALGFWFYLMSDSIIFAILFANYGVLLFGVADGPKPHEVLELSRAGWETAMLLLSSLTFGMASVNALSNNAGRAQLFLFLTACLGTAFLFMEMQEFQHLIAEGDGPSRSGFMSGFFCLVGTHGLHVFFGMIMVIVMIIQISVKGLSEPVLSRLYRVGLFWHFLDIIWIAIFSFVYIPGALQ